MTANQEKFKELVLYISEKSANDKKFGATKLNKLLFFCDFLTFMELGTPITGVAYQRLKNGPAPRCLLPVRQEMVDEGILGVQPIRLVSGKTQHRTVNLRQPNLSIFSGEEISIVDSVLNELEGYDSDQVSELSHLQVGWKVAKDGETIPYGSAYYSTEPLSESEIQRGNEIADARDKSRAA